MKITTLMRLDSRLPAPRFRLLAAAFVLVSMLAACSNGETPRTAEFVPPAPAHSDFGHLRVHYNALPTMALSESVAKQYGVARDADTALVLIALRQMRNGEEVDTEGEVTVQASDLAGGRQQIPLRIIDTGDYTDHIGTATISQRNTYRFDVTIATNGQKNTLQFQRNF